MTIIAFTETKYQYDVISNCVDLTPDIVIHWAIRDVLMRAKKDVVEVPRIFNFLMEGLKLIPSYKVIVIGDFRSFSQYVFIIYALFLKKKIVLGEDGLFSHIADLHNYRSYVFDDGGARSFKKPFFKLLRKKLNSFDRLTTQPNFLKSLKKPINIYFSPLSNFDSGSSQIHISNSTVIFVGQPLKVLGVDEFIFYKKLDEKFSFFNSRYSNLIYSLHPKEDMDLVAKFLKKWTIVGSIDELRKSRDGFDIIGIDSTVLIDERNSCQEIYYVDVSELEFDSVERKAPHIIAQETLLMIAKTKNIKISKVGW